MLTRRRFLALTGFSGIAAAGVLLGYRALPEGSEGRADGPPTFSLGADSCAHCKMIISDLRFAAAWREPAGKTLRFDDIGCMTGKYQDERPSEGSTFWVHDYLDESPMEAAGASFIVAPAIITPMAYGLAAVAAANQAEAIAMQHNGTVHTWQSVLATQSGGH